jgi:hypothetical protein
MSKMGTYFYDDEGNRLASDNDILPIPLFKDMKMTIHGREGEFRVVDWNYHHGHGDEEAGLRIVLHHMGKRSVYEDRGILTL